MSQRINPQDKMINKEHPMEKWVLNTTAKHLDTAGLHMVALRN
jgi:hypothetical protein